MATTNDNSVITRGFLKAYHSRLLPLIPDVSGLESTSNKVSAWSATTNNTHYPTEKLVKDSLDAKQNTINASNKLSASYVSGLATVATSGKYDDLTGKPTIGNGTLTVQANGTSKGTFTANQTGNTTINITASDLGLTDVMHFKGVVSSLPTPTVSDSYSNGDVILVGTKEYVRSGKTASAAGSWIELGDEGSHALKTVTITGTGALGGGGDLSDNRTITHNTSGVTAGTYKSVTVDTYGHVTAGTNPTTLSGYGITDAQEKITTTNKLAASLVSGLATVATSGSYDDLSDKPTIPAAANNGALKIGLNGGTASSLFTANQSSDSTLALASSSTNGKLSVKVGSANAVDVTVYTHPTTAGNKHIPSGGAANQYLKYSSSGTAAWATIAWSDISGKPTIPTVEDGILKLQIDGVDVTTFSANSATDVTTNLFNTATYDNSTTSDTDLNYIFA